MKKLTPRQIIDLIASNNKVISQAEKLIEKLFEFSFENDNEHLTPAITELNEISEANRLENKRLLSEFNEIVRNENRRNRS